MQSIYVFNKQLIIWQDILEKWLEALDQASDFSNGSESPYVHLEQGSNHLLAAAASRNNYATIQEVIGTSLNSTAKRRLDICIYNKNYLALIEAKWNEFQGLDPNKSNHIYCMSQALKDVSNYTNSSDLFKRPNQKIGVMYSTPFFHKEPTDQELQDCIDKITSENSIDAYAYSFLPRDRQLRYHANNNVYPGVILLMKILNTTS